MCVAGAPSASNSFQADLVGGQKMRKHAQSRAAGDQGRLSATTSWHPRTQARSPRPGSEVAARRSGHDGRRADGRAGPERWTAGRPGSDNPETGEFPRVIVGQPSMVEPCSATVYRIEGHRNIDLARRRRKKPGTRHQFDREARASAQQIWQRRGQDQHAERLRGADPDRAQGSRWPRRSWALSMACSTSPLASSSRAPAAVSWRPRRARRTCWGATPTPAGECGARPWWRPCPGGSPHPKTTRCTGARRERSAGHPSRAKSYPAKTQP